MPKKKKPTSAPSSKGPALYWPRDKAFEWIKFHKLIIEIPASPQEQAAQMIESLIKGGFKLLEVPMTILGMRNLFATYASRPGFLIGASQVLSDKMAKEAIAMGAQFLMTPHVDAAIIKIAKKANIFCGAGALTPTEIITAWQWGADMVRVTPVQTLGGHSYIKTLQDPFMNIPLIAAGSIDADDLRDYFISGATAVSLTGSPHFPPVNQIKNGRSAEITAKARRYQETLQRL